MPFYERNLKTTSGADTWQARWFILAFLSTLKDLLCEWFFGALNMVRGINYYPPPLHFQSSDLREGSVWWGVERREEGRRQVPGNSGPVVVASSLCLPALILLHLSSHPTVSHPTVSHSHHLWEQVCECESLPPPFQISVTRSLSFVLHLLPLVHGHRNDL